MAKKACPECLAHYGDTGVCDEGKPVASPHRFKPINTGGDWAYIDQLDGSDIPTSGEPVSVRWPDGTVEFTDLYAEEGTFQYNDHGHEYTGRNRRAYMLVHVHGKAIPFYLRDQKDVKFRRLQ